MSDDKGRPVYVILGSAFDDMSPRMRREQVKAMVERELGKPSALRRAVRWGRCNWQALLLVGLTAYVAWSQL